MVVRRTKTGKLSLLLRHSEREMLSGQFYEFINSMKCKCGKTEKELMTFLHYCTICELFVRLNFHLQITIDKKLQVSISEAAALIWMLRNSEHWMMLNLKSELHKKLS